MQSNDSRPVKTSGQRRRTRTEPRDYLTNAADQFRKARENTDDGWQDAALRALEAECYRLLTGGFRRASELVDRGDGIETDGGSDRLGIREVTDKNGVRKSVAGWPTGLRENRVPTGETDLDYRCPLCGEAGFVDRLNRESNPTCTNRSCRVNRFSPFVDDLDEEKVADTDQPTEGDR